MRQSLSNTSLYKFWNGISLSMSLISVPNDWFGDGNNGYHTRVAMNLIESLGGVNLSSRFINDEMSFLSFEGGDGCLRDRVHEEEDEEKTSRLHTLAKKP